MTNGYCRPTALSGFVRPTLVVVTGAVPRLDRRLAAPFGQDARPM